MKNLPMRIDVETGRLLAVKRTKSHEVRASSFEGKDTSNDIDDVTGSANLFQSCWRNQSGHIIAWPIRLAFIKNFLNQPIARSHDGMFGKLLFFRNSRANQER